MNLSAWRACLRIARREAWRAKGRSLLVIALIGLPVIVLAGADIAYRTWQLDPQEKLTRTLGSADASVGWAGGPVQQSPKGPDGGYSTQSTSNTPPPVPSTATVVSALPPGSRVIERWHTFGSITTQAGRKFAELNGLDYANPMAKGLVHQVSGRAPHTADEIAFTRSLAHDTGLRIGDEVNVVNPDRSFRLVGIVADASYRHTAAAYTLPTAMPDAGPANQDPADVSWLVDAPDQVTWPQILHLNRLGFVVLSRSVYLNPPPRSQVPYELSDSNSPINAKAATTATLIGGMALLEIVLLAGPAFAVSARRQRRELALVAAVGGRRQDLRNVVLSKGIVLGVVGGVLSLFAAVGLTAIGIATIGRYVNQLPGHFDVRPVELFALGLVSLLTALAAAVFPARGAARTDVVAALAGRRGVVRTRKRVPLLGAVIAGAGILVALGALGASANATVILAGVALTEIGLIICTPTLLGLAARAGRWLPLSPRIALRDAGRNRSSAAPAVAAVMAAVIGSVALAIGVASANDQDRRTYTPSLPINDAFVPLDESAGQADAIAAALRSTLPGSRATIVHAPDNSCDNSTCTTTDVALAEAGLGPSSYIGGSLPSPVIDDGSGVELLLQRDDPAAVTALRAGKAVTTDPSTVHSGRVRLQVNTTTTDANGTTTSTDKAVQVDAVVASQQRAFVQLILPPSLAAELGVKVRADDVFVATAHRPTDREQQAAAAALSKVDPNLRLYVETGYHNPILWMMLALVVGAGIITVGATTIATALSNVDGRPDLTTLGAVGAAPRTRRLLSMSRAGVIAGIGTALGAAAGFVPAYAWIHSQTRAGSLGLSSVSVYVPGSDSSTRLHMVIPWLPIGATVIIVPAVAAVLAGLFSRSRLPSERPAD